MSATFPNGCPTQEDRARYLGQLTTPAIADASRARRAQIMGVMRADFVEAMKRKAEAAWDTAASQAWREA